jgi:hypothetical protein
MSLFITDSELDAILSADKDSQLGRLRDSLFARVFKNTAEPKLVQSSDTQEWWHLVWERMSDASFCYAAHKYSGETDSERIIGLGNWIRDRTLEICRKDIDEWVGPWFRQRKKPLCGMLETAHIVNAVSDAYILCPDLFSENESAEILTAIREKGLLLCEEYTKVGHFNNWYCVISGGYASAAVVLNEREKCERAVELYNKCCALYDSDGYGETLQYGNYASLSLSHMREVLLRYDKNYASRLPLSAMAGTIKWMAASFFYMKPLGGVRGSAPYPRSANFGDCAAIFRPTGDLLLQIASEYQDEVIAGLARWLFDTTYSDPTLGPDELATFGFFNQFQYQSLLYLPRAKKALSPVEANMPLKNIFTTGTATLRDKLIDPETILAVQCGYETHNVDSHRHADQNSFILCHKKERFFADPGHCCYRLETWVNSKKTEHHNTWDFVDENGRLYTQSNVKAKAKPINNLVEYDTPAGWEIIASDCHEAYGVHFERCERVFACAFPNVMFIIDYIKADVPIKMTSHFILNNRDGGLKTHIADPVRLVFRRGDAGIKFFTFAAGSGSVKLSQRYGFIHDNYHPLPNHIGQGKEGSALIYDYTTENFALEHVIIHAFAMDGTETVKGWHIKPDVENSYRITSPKNETAYLLKINPGEKNWFSLDIIK